MAFRDERQRSAACRAILIGTTLRHYWKDEVFDHYGPTNDAVGQLLSIQNGACPLSHSEQILLRVAFDVWNGTGNVSLWEILTYLDPVDVAAIGELFMNIGTDDPANVDAWIEEWTLGHLSD